MVSNRTFLAALFCLLWTTKAHAQQDLIPFGAEWLYLSPAGIDDDPSNVDFDFDDTWFLPDYDTSSPVAWDGPSAEPLGYGTINGFVNGFGTELDTPLSGDRYTSYFRHEFTTTSDASMLAFELLIDDGAKIYLDGEEILSRNCCEFAVPGEVSTFLESSSATGNEDLYSFEEVLPGGTLSAGDHVLAVAVHNGSPTSSDLGFSLRFISGYEPPKPDPNAILTGIDTTLPEFGLLGPGEPNGGEAEWEWDGEDAGGQNFGLIWFDIPQDRLDNFGEGTATLRLFVTNEGSSADVHRVTSDWLTGPDGGDNVTYWDIADGPGLYPTDNVREAPSFSTGDLTAGDYVEFDVTEDVLSWASGIPNYGWGFLPTGTNGVGISSFESDRGPQLILVPEGEGGILGDVDGDGTLSSADIDFLGAAIAVGDMSPELDLNADGVVNEADRLFMIESPDIFNTFLGDSTLDGEFSSSDFVAVFQAGFYEDGIPNNAGWAEGDWNGDGDFDTSDFVAAFQAGAYENGPRAGVNAVPEPSGALLWLMSMLLWSAAGRRP